MTDQDVEVYRQLQKSPILFVKMMWGLTPQEKGGPFKKGKNFTWQQHEILLAVEKALRGEAQKRISVRSGHGIGKSATVAWLTLWYLFCFKNAQIPVTAPTSDQMYDVLWKEISVWLGRMPKPIQDKYEWSTSYVRITESPATWFARAKTARKEAPEALAGVHGDYVMFLIDEASGVPEEVFNTAEGALTTANILVVMISNPTRLVGYFYDSHHSDAKSWQTLHFNSEESPIVDPKFVERIIEKHGRDSDEYRIRVEGNFPKEDAIDDKGYVPLLSASDLHFRGDEEPQSLFTGKRKMGIDPAGEGKDTTDWVVRDAFKAKRVASEKVSNAKSVAQKTLTLMELYEVEPEDVFVDNFGEGANVAKELALASTAWQRIDVNAVNVGDQAEDPERYINSRAEAYYRAKNWLRSGGELVNDEVWKKELPTIRYRRELSGKIKIMPKLEMRKEGYPSPNTADALMLTFVTDDAPKKGFRQFIPKH